MVEGSNCHFSKVEGSIRHFSNLGLNQSGFTPRALLPVCDPSDWNKNPNPIFYIPPPPYQPPYTAATTVIAGEKRDKEECRDWQRERPPSSSHHFADLFFPTIATALFTSFFFPSSHFLLLLGNQWDRERESNARERETIGAVSARVQRRRRQKGFPVTVPLHRLHPVFVPSSSHSSPPSLLVIIELGEQQEHRASFGRSSEFGFELSDGFRRLWRYPATWFVFFRRGNPHFTPLILS